jgi:hypothetical protein
LQGADSEGGWLGQVAAALVPPDAEVLPPDELLVPPDELLVPPGEPSRPAEAVPPVALPVVFAAPPQAKPKRNVSARKRFTSSWCRTAPVLLKIRQALGARWMYAVSRSPGETF